MQNAVLLCPILSKRTFQSDVLTQNLFLPSPKPLSAQRGGLLVFCSFTSNFSWAFAWKKKPNSQVNTETFLVCLLYVSCKLDLWRPLLDACLLFILKRWFVLLSGCFFICEVSPFFFNSISLPWQSRIGSCVILLHLFYCLCFQSVLSCCCVDCFTL